MENFIALTPVDANATNCTVRFPALSRPYSQWYNYWLVNIRPLESQTNWSLSSNVIVLVTSVAAINLTLPMSLADGSWEIRIRATSLRPSMLISGMLGVNATSFTPAYRFSTLSPIGKVVEEANCVSALKK